MRLFLVTLAVEVVAIVFAYYYTKRIVSRIREKFRSRMENPRPLFKAEKDVYFNREYARPHDHSLKKTG